VDGEWIFTHIDPEIAKYQKQRGNSINVCKVDLKLMALLKQMIYFIPFTTTVTVTALSAGLL
jgi:hypothetical protein